MDAYEQKIVDILNENEYINNTGIIITEINMTNKVNAFDKEKFTTIVTKANELLNDNLRDTIHARTDIINIILDSINFTITSLTGTYVNRKASSLVPDNLKMVVSFIIKGKERKVSLNPIKYMLNIVISGLISKLFKMAVSPIEVKNMIYDYKRIISSLTELKNTTNNKKTKDECVKLIQRINNEIEKLSSKSKGEKKMKTIGEMLSESDEYGCYDDYDYSVRESSYDEYDDFGTILENTIYELDEACKSEGCKSEGCKSEGCKTRTCRSEACGSKRRCSEEDDMMDDDMPDDDMDIEDEFAFF